MAARWRDVLWLLIPVGGAFAFVTAVQARWETMVGNAFDCLECGVPAEPPYETEDGMFCSECYWLWYFGELG